MNAVRTRRAGLRMTPAQAVGLLAVATLVGCVAPTADPTLAERTVPPDFSVQLHVQGKAGATDLAQMTSVYLLGPSRRLRVGFGARVTFDTFPAVRRILTPAEVEELHTFVVEHKLRTPPSDAVTDPQSSPDASVQYEIAIAGDGSITRYKSDAALQLALPELVRLLARLGRIDAPTAGDAATDGAPRP